MKSLIIKIIVLVGLGIFMLSCSDDYLDLDPTEAISEADVFTNTNNAWPALSGIHRFMYMNQRPGGGHSSHAGHGGNLIMHEMMGEDLVNHDTGGNWFIGVHNWISHRNESGTYTIYPYRFFYTIIANANMIIKYIGDAEGPTYDKEFIKGQALAYRAWAYHQLVQAYAKRYDWNAKPNNQLGVPLVLAPTTQGFPRETVENVYEQINIDLTNAIELLKNKNHIPFSTETPKSHITIDVAKGMKARVALTQGNWERAAQLANEARQNWPLMDEDELLSGFNNKDNPEFMWVSHITQEHTYAFSSFFSYMSWNRNSTNVRNNPKKICGNLYEKISDTDLRKQWFASSDEEARERQPNTSYTAVQYMSFKIMAPDEASGRGDLCYMRTAEMYLIEAEALARAGIEGEARSVLYDLISTRDSDYELSTKSGDDLIEEILTHRRIELWGEGFRWLDLKRLNLALERDPESHATVTTTWEIPINDILWQYRIPRAEINANPLIIQND